MLKFTPFLLSDLKVKEIRIACPLGCPTVDGFGESVDLLMSQPGALKTGLMVLG